MIIIRTWEELAQALAGPLDAPLYQILSDHRDRLAEFEHYDLRELCCFVLVEPADQIEAIHDIRGFPFGAEPEYRLAHQGWTEIVFIASDDGFGWVLLIPD
jgi:hypothetical protein